MSDSYITNWYDTRTSNLVWREYIENDVSQGTDIIETSGVVGEFGWVTSYRGPKKLPSYRYVHNFGAYKLSYNYTGNGYIYASLTPGWKYIYSGRCAGAKFFTTGRWTNNLPYHDNSRLIAAVSSELYQKASEPYVPSYHWFGEMRETLESLKSPLKGARTLGKNLKRALNALTQKKQAGHISLAEFAESAASAHLEFTFGMVPLVGMTNSIMEKIAELNNELNVVRRVYKSSRRLPVAYSSGIFNGYIEWKDEQVLTARGSMMVQYVEHGKLDFTRFSPLTLLNQFATEGFQLLGLSFLVDWFVHISALLKESRPIPGTVLYGTITAKSRRDQTFTITSIPSSYYTCRGPMTMVLTAESTDRTTNVTRPGILTFGWGLNSVGKSMSVLSLLASAFAGKFKPRT